MKIAVCLSGQPRAYKAAARSILETFRNTKDIQVDFYIFAWTNNTSYTTPNCDDVLHDMEGLKRDLISMYHPKGIRVEDEEEVAKICGVIHPKVTANAYNFFQNYHMISSISIALETGGYDYYIWTRIDMLFYNFSGERYNAPNINVGTLRRLYEQPCHVLYNVGEKLRLPAWSTYLPNFLDFLYFGREYTFRLMRETLMNTFFKLLTYEDRFTEEDRNIRQSRFACPYLENDIPLWAFEHQIGLYTVPDLFEENSHMKVLKQCYVDAGIDYYDRKDFLFAESYPCLYLYKNITTDIIKKLRILYGEGKILPFFQKTRWEETHPITAIEMRKALVEYE